MSVPEPLTVNVLPLRVKEPATPTAPMSPPLKVGVLAAAAATIFLVDDGLVDDRAMLLDDGAMLVDDAAACGRGAADGEVAS